MNKIRRTKRIVPYGVTPGFENLRRKGYQIRDCYQIGTENGKDIYMIKYSEPEC